MSLELGARSHAGLRLALLPLALFACSAAVEVGGEFTCPQGFPAPAVLDPGDDVTKLHPAHVRYVAAFGDSISTSFAAEGLPLEYRELSFSSGVGSPGHHTLQWLLGHYEEPGAEPVTGGATQPHAPFTKDHYLWKFAQHDHLSVAVSGSTSAFGVAELDRLRNQTVDLGVGDGWMVVTILLGGNDLCGPLTTCGTPEQQQGVVDKFQTNIDALLSALVAWRKRLYINLVQMFRLGRMYELEKGHPYCVSMEETTHECRCILGNAVFNDTQRAANAVKLDDVANRINEGLLQVARKYDLIRPDIGVNVVRTVANVSIPDLSYLSTLDCFHPAAKTHNLLSHGLWNAMLVPSKPTPLEDEAAWRPMCANATSRLVTVRDQEPSSPKQPRPAVRGAEDVIVV